jgi:hypothetical protein
MSEQNPKGAVCQPHSPDLSTFAIVLIKQVHFISSIGFLWMKLSVKCSQGVLMHMYGVPVLFFEGA